MGLFGAVSREVKYITSLARILKRVSKVQGDPDLLTVDQIEESVDRHADRPALMEDDTVWTYAEMDAYANRVAHWAVAQGLKPGDTVAIYMQNRIEYFPIWYGLSKVGVVGALLNNQLFGSSLAHTITIAEARHIIVDVDLQDNFESARGELKDMPTDWFACGACPGRSFEEALEGQPDDRPARDRRAGEKAADTCLKMFTSGTTGLPKVARMTHTRVLTYMNTFAVASRSNDEDRVMMVLPLYHATGGLCGVGTAIMAGGAVIVRRRFSASSFWDEAIRYKATILMYVGELCRFLMAQDSTPKEREHQIRCAIGNGLRPDVWTRFVKRTGIEFIVEFYGATEGNVALLNVGGQPGSIGRVAPYLKSRFNIELIRHDVETSEPVRNAEGHAIVVEPDEVGEAIGEIKPGDPRYRFDGYANKEETEKKILRDVFETGDAWFRTGDLMKRDKLGNYYFIDRIGDTYRWMAENVATSEVEEAIGVLDSVEQAVVYGVKVPGYDGRAGMAAITTGDDFDLDSLMLRLKEDLPAYARPIFLRMRTEPDTTGTFKYRKKDLKEDGFDPVKVGEPLFYLDPETGRYEPLDGPAYEAINGGNLRF